MAAVGIVGVSSLDGYIERAELDEFKTQTPSLEELVQTVNFGPATTVTATGTAFGAWVAPFPCKITTASLIAYGGSNIAASNTNYWAASLRKLTNSGGTITSAVISTKTTRVDSGEAIVARADWNFDARVFDPPAALFAKGDVLDVLWNATGSPTTWTGPILVFRYEPVGG